MLISKQNLILIIFFIAVIGCSIPTSSFNQKQSYSYVDCKNNAYDSLISYKLLGYLQKSLDLKPLNYTSDTFYFRFWRVNQAIDIWTTDYENFGGIVTSFYEKYKELKIGESAIDREVKTVKRQSVIDSRLAKQVYNLIDSCKLTEIRSDADIFEWRKGLDGFSYEIELSTTKNYLFNTYWSPNHQNDSIVEARAMVSFDNRLKELLNLKEIEKEFNEKLPAGSYHISGTSMFFQKITTR